MSCNNTNSTCSSCNHNYSSCNNKCAKCGCKDSFLTSPPPCPTPEGCPDPIPCQEVLSSDCIIYNGPNIECNDDVIITSDSTWAESLQDLVDYFCTTYSNVPEILCSEDVVVIADSSVNEALEQIVEYFCAAIVGIPPITANNGLNMSAPSNVQLGGTLIQNTTINNSTFDFIVSRNNSGDAIQGINSSSGKGVVGSSVSSHGVVGVSTSGKGIVGVSTSGVGVDAVSGTFRAGQFSISPVSDNTVAENTVFQRNVAANAPGNDGIGQSLIFAQAAKNSSLYPANSLISKWTDSGVTTRTSEFSITGVNAAVTGNKLILSGNGSLRLPNYGIGTFTGVPAYNLSTTALGNVIETTAGLFGTGFRGYISPNSFPFKAVNKPNSNISLGDTVVFDTTNGIIEYQIKDGVNFSQYNQTTGVWTCPQTGKYDFNYNVYLSSPANTYGWGEVGGTFTIGITDPTGAAIIYCADTFTAVQSFYYDKIYMTGGIQGKNIPAGTQIVLKIQNLTGLAYTQIPSRGDNIDWAIRRVG